MNWKYKNYSTEYNQNVLHYKETISSTYQIKYLREKALLEPLSRARLLQEFESAVEIVHLKLVPIFLSLKYQ